jgi:uncharacterized membrane-anchored protein YhcB (DUF1043 family)
VVPAAVAVVVSIVVKMVINRLNVQNQKRLVVVQVEVENDRVSYSLFKNKNYRK